MEEKIMKQHKVDISIVIPCYNEEERIISSINTIVSFMNSFNPSFEIIIVDDGSRDNSVTLIKNYISTRDNVEILIGADSQNYSNKKTIYGVVIALYQKGKGAHVLCSRESVPVERNTSTRLLNKLS
jgi:glycosyltransferase involved in cell wall biosynthesis